MYTLEKYLRCNLPFIGSMHILYIVNPLQVHVVADREKESDAYFNNFDSC